MNITIMGNDKKLQEVVLDKWPQFEFRRFRKTCSQMKTLCFLPLDFQKLKQLSTLLSIFSHKNRFGIFCRIFQNNPPTEI